MSEISTKISSYIENEKYINIIKEVKAFLGPLNDWNTAIASENSFYTEPDDGGYHDAGFYGRLGLCICPGTDRVDSCPDIEDWTWLETGDIRADDIESYVDSLPYLLDNIIEELEWDEEYQDKYKKKHGTDIHEFIEQIKVVRDSIRGDKNEV